MRKIRNSIMMKEYRILNILSSIFTLLTYKRLEHDS